MVNAEEALGRRKEPRFKTCEGQVLECVCAVNDVELNQGTVVDLSASGLRILCEGTFEVGQEFSAELKTDQSHGSYRGVIRRVQPWVSGKSVLGCQLIDTIPTAVLQELAERRIINRRRDVRVQWKQPAKMSWELHSGEVEIQIEDCSPGGLRITSPTVLPENVRLRIRVTIDEGEAAIIDARSVWQIEQDDRVQAGLAITTREVPAIVARVLAGEVGKEPEAVTGRASFFRRVLVAGTVIVILGFALKQIGLWG